MTVFVWMKRQIAISHFTAQNNANFAEKGNKPFKININTNLPEERSSPQNVEYGCTGTRLHGFIGQWTRKPVNQWPRFTDLYPHHYLPHVLAAEVALGQPLQLISGDIAYRFRHGFEEGHRQAFYGLGPDNL